MDREVARRRAEVMLAFANGCDVQFYNGVTKQWEDIAAECVGFDSQTQYRVKPLPKYRPFKNKEECWNEMLKHQPFAFLSGANEYDWFSICRVFEEEGIPKITFASNPYSDYDMTKVFDKFQFADGTPFGIKEE